MPFALPSRRRRRPVHGATLARTTLAHTAFARVACALATLTLGAVATPRPLAAQVAPAIERPVPFDSAGRVPTLTPTLVARLALAAPAWPVTGDFREARLYRTEAGAHVLVVQRPDGSVLRFAVPATALVTLRQAVGAGLLASAAGTERLTDAATGLEISQPAGNAFVRNQGLLGLVAYGPATAALLSNSGGAAAAGGYLVAAGTSFFLAANTVKNRTVTRAQASLASHGGTRGALAGAASAAIANANGGPGYGAPILAGAVGGTLAGYRLARGLSDGEAASAGLIADLGAFTVLGATGASGAFRRDRRFVPFDPERPEFGGVTETSDRLRDGGKLALGGAIGASVLGYAIGPRYARRAAYNVTAGDASVVLTAATLGAVTFTGFANDAAGPETSLGVATGGLLLGALFADRALVRTRDRTAADGALIRLGTLAGALVGGGVAAIAETERQPALLMAGVGGFIGMFATDGILKPAQDAGPLRGIMQGASRALDDRVRVSIGPVSSVHIAW
jgi:hypothetical protein